MSIDIDFPGKQENEEVKLLLRQHPFILIRQNIIYLFYFIVPLILYLLGKSYFAFILSFPIYPIFILLISLYYFFFLFFFLIEWVDYYFDAWIVTDRRLIDVEQIGLFRRSVSETRLEKMQDVSFEIKGLFGTIFHYGLISVQTAGAAQNFTINKVSDPAKIKTILLNLYDERIKSVGSTQGQNIDLINATTSKNKAETAPSQNQKTLSAQKTPSSTSTPLSTPQAPSTPPGNPKKIIQDIK